jgi:hypothetical protein
LGTRHRRSSGVVNQAMQLAGSASSETKDQCDCGQPRANEAERIRRRLAIGANGAG